MKVIRLHFRGGPEALVLEDAPLPRPGEGELLVRVHAAAVTPSEFDWVPTWTMRTGESRSFPIILGHEFSGEIQASGPGVADFADEDVVREAADVVFDTVGGVTLARSWGVLKTGGRMITIAASSEQTRERRVREGFSIVEPNAGQLARLTSLIDGGEIRPVVGAILPLAKARHAYEHRPVRARLCWKSSREASNSRAQTAVRGLHLLGASDGGSSFFHWWRRWESNPRPEILGSRHLHQ